jgi:methylenetetrahydrofolate--tRNA-(uracil-5-)-methyltransferase
MIKDKSVAIIGAGLAGCEAAWQLASRNFPVTLFEMRPQTTTEAHRTDQPAELVCSNSFKSLDVANAHGLLKAELEAAGSLIIRTAHSHAVPAGSALAVDRETFSLEIKTQLSNLQTIEFKQLEVKEINPLLEEFAWVIIAGGPLMSTDLTLSLKEILEDEGLFFYDAIAPVVDTDSINMEIAYKASRYDKGDADYINCPLNEADYMAFIENLVTSAKVPFKEFEQAKHFEGCLPIEVMASRGAETLSFGPMKPVGLIDPRTGKRPWAVLQLRQENRNASLYNMVGCQTRMTQPEQRKIFRCIPGLENCEFARYGSMHRNTYINAPLHLDADLSLKKIKQVSIAGQLTGVEGYTESTAMGLWAAMNIFSKSTRGLTIEPDRQTMIGALVHYLQTASSVNFQPMNANFGLVKPYQGPRIKNKKERRGKQAELALKQWQDLLRNSGWNE